MKNYYVYSCKNDLMLDDNINTDNISVSEYKTNNYIYKTIYFKLLDNNLKETLKKELIFFLKLMNISKNDHIFIIGLGNDNHTADSVGPKVLKHIKVNSYLENIGIKIDKNKISALEPGVLSETGILTEKIIASVSSEIKPNLIILIDSFVSDNINYLNRTISLNNRGLTTGNGIKNINSNIDYDSIGIPILVIGVTTATLIKFTDDNDINYTPYILSTKDIDSYVYNISKIIGSSLNEVIDDL